MLENDTIICKNCNDEYSQEASFCPSCGQKRFKRLTLLNSLEHFFSTYFAIDSGLVNTIVPFIFKPGIVPKEYIKGKQKSYIGPWQVYFFFSFLFFLVLSSLYVKDWDARFENQLKKGLNSLNLNFTVNDSLSFNATTIDSLRLELEKDSLNQELQSLDSLENNLSQWTQLIKAGKTNNEIYNDLFPDVGSKWIMKPLISLATNIIRNQGKGFLLTLFSQFALGLFSALLLFSFILYLLYIRQDFTFVEHFVNNLYYFGFLFLLFAYMLMVLSAFPNPIFFLISIIIAALYFYKNMRNLYGQGRVKTLLKFGLANILGLLVIPIVMFTVVFLMSLIRYS